MKRKMRTGIAVLAVVAVAATAGAVYHSRAQDTSATPKATAVPKREAVRDSPDVAAVRKVAEEFAVAVNKGDAQAVAAFWAKESEYVGPDGGHLRGRDEIAKSYAEFFKKNPKAVIEVKIATVRLLGRHTALEEGILRLEIPGAEPGETRYSVLHIREDDQWKMASVREWIPSPGELISLKDIEWLVGEWTAKAAGGTVLCRYAWDDAKTFLRSSYTVKKDGKLVSSGTQIIGKDPAGGLRSWQFDSSGSFGEAKWSRDDKRWVIEGTATLPDGSEASAVNLLMPLGKDAFTWQSVERTAAGNPVPDTPPLKVTRVK